jgi:protein disulfide-isomerase A6
LATDFASEPNVLVAKVDAEAENAKATAQDQGVKSYPTIKFFPKGSTEGIPYTGARTEKDFIAYINEKAGTHRAVGGGLDATAGTIEALDTILAKLATGATVASITADITEAAKSLKDKYAEYYVKVLGKVAASSSYAQKELGRLEGLLKKGGLAPAKVDDLVSRTNILRKFLSDDTAKSEL